MTTYRVLFVDNDVDFLETRAEFLELAGYQVLKASTLAEARQILMTRHVHLVILDIRMSDDHDEKDTSGVTFAKDPSVHPVPKIILTEFPTYQTVRDVLGPVLDGLPPAVGYLDKNEGPEAMIEAVADTLRRHSRINHQLSIRWRAARSFLQLLNLIDPEIDSSFWVERTNELEDLWRNLFYDYDQIIVGRLFVQKPSRVLLEIYAYTAERGEGQFIIDCGYRPAIGEENERYKTFSANSNESVATDLIKTAATIHFAASLYQLAGVDLEMISPFRTFYLRQPTEGVLAVIEQLFTTTLSRWHAKHRSYGEGRNLHEFYREWLGLTPTNLTNAALEARISSICQKILTVGTARFDYSAHKLTFYQLGGLPVVYPNPVACLDKEKMWIVAPTLWGVTHGAIDADTLLIGPNGRTWLVDFAQVGLAPLLRDFVALEMAVRLELLDSFDLPMCYQFEKHLHAPVELGAATPIGPLPPEFVKPLRVIQHIRHHAAIVVGTDPKPYLSGLFFYALAQIAPYDPAVRYTKQELITFAHNLLVAAMNAEPLTGISEVIPALPDQARNSLWIDAVNKTAWVEGRCVELTQQEFNLLTCLYKNAGQLCSRRVLIEEGLGDTYEETTLGKSQLNSAMSRLRQKLEPNPKAPKYLITDHGYGYKLRR